MSRVPTHRYRDPVERVWLACASRIGFRVVRSNEVYASSDGAGTITLSDAAGMDPDDGLAQMIFHELCHSLIEGENALVLEDWGLDNRSERDVPREHACLRLQATLAGRHGLRRVLAPTTDFRAFYDVLPEGPIDGRSDDAIVARRGLQRAAKAPWGPHLEEALVATAAIARAATGFAAGVVEEDGRPSLWALVDAAPDGHPAGGIVAAGEGGCGTCAWHGLKGRCAVRSRRVDEAWPRCDAWEPALDCLDCGACCREAFHAVDVGPRESVIKRHPELIVFEDGRHGVLRDGERCAALEGSLATKFTCRIYEDRPRTCQDFALGSGNCLVARRRVGLSA